MTAPVVSGQALFAEIRSRVEALGVAFGDGKKPAAVGTKPWIVAWFDAGRVEDRSMRSRDGWSAVGVFHCVGLTPESARIATRVLRTVLLGLHLAVIDGRAVQMPEHLSSPPMQRDDDVDPPIYDQIDEWRIRTTPA